MLGRFGGQFYSAHKCGKLFGPKAQQFAQRRRAPDVAGSALVHRPHPALVLQGGDTGYKGGWAVMGEEMPDEVRHHARVVLALLLAPPSAYQVDLSLGIGEIASRPSSHLSPPQTFV